MSNLPLKALPWEDTRHEASVVDSVIHSYEVVKDYVLKNGAYRDTGKFLVRYKSKRHDSPIKEATGFATIEDAKEWCWNHYNEKMQPYVAPDSITDIANWFKAAKPEPTKKDVCTQLGCHFEEVAELATSIRAHNSAEIINEIAETLKGALPQSADNYINKSDHIELLDALCDQIVTATGVAYMMGFDIEGALKEVIRSNNSKMVKGKFEYDENGKMKKGESYSAPDLTPFVSKQGE